MTHTPQLEPRSQYKPESLDACFAHIVEEAGEVIAAYGKAIRFGWHSVNPELPTKEQETNLDWFYREVDDLMDAIDFMESQLR